MTPVDSPAVSPTPAARRGQVPVVVIPIVAQLDGAWARQNFKREIVDLVVAGDRRFVLDFAQCGYVDSAGLGALVSVTRVVRTNGGVLVLCGLNDDLVTLFELTRMSSLFQVAPTTIEAMVIAYDHVTGGDSPS